MSAARLPGWHETVRRHWKGTTVFLLASSQPCIKVRDEELAAIRGNRVLVGFLPDDLAAWKPPKSWMLAVLLCPGDNAAPVAKWTKATKADPRRVRFYLHPKTDWDSLRPWHDAGYPTDRVNTGISTWRQLHKLLGLALADRIVEDWWDEGG